MKRQKIQLIILLAVLAVLGAGYLLLRRYNEQQVQQPEEAEGYEIYSVAEEDITAIGYDYDGNHYDYEKEEGAWYYAPNHDLKLTQSRLNTIASNLAELRAQDVIEGVTDLAQYGLAEPERTFSFTAGGESYTFHIGSLNSTLNVYYISRPGEDTVYTVKSHVITAFNMDVMDIAEEEEESTESTSEEASAESTEAAEEPE